MENAAVLDAIEYHQLGWAVLPVRRGRKKPVAGDNWRTVRYGDEADIRRDFFDMNIGVIMGAASGNLIDIDLDEPLASSIASALMPETLTFGRRGKPKSHRLYRLTDWSVGCRKFYDPIIGTTLVEIRGDGGQTVFPGSVHMSGEAIEWDTTNGLTEPLELTREQLNNYIGMTVAATALAKYWPNGSRHMASMSLTGWLVRNNIGAEEIQGFVHAIVIAAKDEEPRDRLQAVATTLERYAEGDDVSGYPSLAEHIDTRILKAVSKWMGIAHRTVSEKMAIGCTDEGNVDRFIAQHHDVLRYCAEQKSWYVWNQKIWEKDVKRYKERLAAQTAKSIYLEAAAAETQVEREELANWATQSNNITRLEAMIKRAESRAEVVVSIHDFDVHPDLFTCANGTFDLSTGTLLNFDREHMITKMIAGSYDASAPVPYQVHMVTLSISDAESLKALQKAGGLSLSGRTDKAIFFCFGPTDTGKTTFLTQGILKLLGDYGKQVSLEAIAGGRERSKEMWIADMHGARFALASEPPKGFTLDVAAIKSMTGDSIQKARALYEMPFDSTPVATIFIDTNYRPDIPDGDDAIWNRLQLIHFKNKVKKVPGEPGYIPNFKERISEPVEMSGLLNWLIEGYRLWQEEGLTRSEQMESDKDEYRSEQDTIAMFIDECTISDENAFTPVKELYNRYVLWSRSHDIDATGKHSHSALNDTLTGTHGWTQKVIRIRGSNQSIRAWMGIQLLNDSTTKTIDEGNEQTFPRYEGS